MAVQSAIRSLQAGALAAARFGAFLCFLVIIQGFAAVAETPKATGARVSGDASRSRFIADLTAPVSYSVYVLANPYRIVIDLPEVNFQLPSGIGQQVRGLIHEYRYGKLETGQSRIVLDVSGPVLIEKSFLVPPQGDQPARIVVDIVPTDNATFLKTHLAEQVQLAKSDFTPASLSKSVSEPEAKDDPLIESAPLSFERADTASPVGAAAQAEARAKPAYCATIARTRNASENQARCRHRSRSWRHRSGCDRRAGKPKKRTLSSLLPWSCATSCSASGKYDVVMTREKDTLCNAEGAGTHSPPRAGGSFHRHPCRQGARADRARCHRLHPF